MFDRILGHFTKERVMFFYNEKDRILNYLSKYTCFVSDKKSLKEKNLKNFKC